jgi:two-component system nitrogen regulation sensor histidine kinase GlnL
MVAARFEALDLLLTLIAVVDPQGFVLFSNAALEDQLGISRKSIVGAAFSSFFTDPGPWHNAMAGANANAFATLRYDAGLRRMEGEDIPVHVLINRTEGPGSSVTTVVEMVPLAHQTRQVREERWHEQAQSYQELIRNLAHEIKNPLGGIRGSAQLLEMDLPSKELRQYTQVIIQEADRLHSLVDRLLAPHRSPHQVSDVNIHEITEHVLSLIVAEFPLGLRIVRDYDTSIPEFRGDREHMIQALLNIVRNAAHALSQRIAQADAEITVRTRVTRQITFAKQRYRLAIELHIIDNGSGIPESLKDKIFYPLVSGTEGGSGLGLTLAQTFVQQHQGLITFESQPGRTDFQILIPLV